MTDVQQAHYERVLGALESVLENEEDGYGNCRYCGASDKPYKDGEPMVVVDGNVEDAGEFVIDDHAEWCPSMVLGKMRTPACLQLPLLD